MTEPINLDRKRNKDWLDGAAHGQATERARLADKIGPAIAQLHARSGSAETAAFLAGILMDLGLPDPRPAPVGLRCTCTNGCKSATCDKL